MSPAVTVIVPARNDAPALGRTLDWLAGLDGIAAAEIIVSAWGDPGGTLGAVGGRARLLWPTGSTRAALMNAGAAAARGDVLFFLHADSFPPRDALGLIEEALVDPRVVGGAFEHSFADPAWSLRAITWTNRVRYRLTRNYYGDHGIFVRARDFWAVGGSPEVALMEDLVLSQRLKRLGRVRLVRAPLRTSGRRFLLRGPRRTFWFVRSAAVPPHPATGHAALRRAGAGPRPPRARQPLAGRGAGPAGHPGSDFPASLPNRPGGVPCLRGSPTPGPAAPAARDGRERDLREAR